MGKRESVRALMAFDAQKRPVSTTFGFVCVLAGFILVENGWLAPEYTVLIGQALSLPTMKRLWDRENIQQRYLVDERAIRHVHNVSVGSFISLLFLLVLIFGWASDRIETPVFLTIFVAGIVLTSLLHTWHVKRMTRWDDNFVTPDELVEEQKWGSA